MKRLSKYTWVALVSAQSNLAYFGDVASRLVFLAVILYIFMRLWQVTYGETGATRLGGLTLSQMLWYLAVTESITMSAPRVAQVVDEDVRTGSLAVQLIRPISYPLYRLWVTLGERLVRFTMCAVVAAILVWFLVGAIPSQPLGLAMLLLSLPLAFVLDFLGNFFVGLGAFWLEDTNGLLLIYSRLTMIFGGMLLPLELFPPAMQTVLKALPFASIVYGPARIFIMPDWGDLTALLLKQSAGVAAFALVVALIYRRALKRVYANGG